MAALPNQLTLQVLKLIDRQRPLRPSIQALMDPPVSIYYAIKQMYNSFKKDNQSRILRNKVYDLKVYQQKKCLNERKITNVSMQSLFSSHSKNQSIQLINNLLILKDYLPSDLQSQLIIYISNQIMKIDDLPMVLSFFKKLLISKQSLNDKQGLYKQLQLKMINKLQNFQQMFSQIQIKQISTFLYGLPTFEVQILQLITLLFDKVQNISNFQSLGLLYTNIYKKLQNTQQNQINMKLQQTFMKITTKEHLQIIQQKILGIRERRYKKEKEGKQDVLFQQLLKQEAIRKMLQWSKINNIKQKQQYNQLDDKQIQTINFIVLTLQCEALGNPSNSAKQKETQIIENYSVWSYFISFYHLNVKLPAWFYYISEKLTILFHKIFQIPKVMLKLMELFLSIQAGLNFNKSVTLYKNSLVINLNQSLSSYLIREIVSDKLIRNRYLLNKIARFSVAFGMVCDQLDIYYKIIVNPSNLQYIEVILQLFDLPNSLQYFKQILANSSRRIVLQTYLLKLLQQKPKKYTDFFIKIDSRYQGQIFEFQDYYLFRFFSQHITSQIALCFLRQMSTYTPSRYNIQIINTLIKHFEKKLQFKLVYYQAVRSLHIILSTYEAENLSVQFKKHLRDIVESKVIAGNQVFKNVPEKMINGLTAFYKASEPK